MSRGLVLHQRVLLGGQTVLHSNEGPITALAWRGALIAWMNERGVKVYNIKTGQKAPGLEVSLGRLGALEAT